MEKQKKVMEKLKGALQKKAGKAFDVEKILEISPIMTEARILDHGTKRRFCARLYHVDADHHTFMEKAWSMARSDKQPMGKLPQPSYGLKNVGKYKAHIAANTKGLDLAGYLRMVGICRSEYVVRMGLNLARALQTLETAGVEHHDIKPVNIICANDGRVILKNAGLYSFENSLAEKLAVAQMGDIRYKAPEQLRGETPTIATDIYQIGLVLYEMLAGRPPFTGSYDEVKESHLSKPVPNPQAFNPDVNIGLVRVLAKALTKKPGSRFTTLAEFQQTLEMLLPAVERPNIMNAAVKQVDDEARLQEQVSEAKALAGKKDYPGALRLLDGQLLIAGPRPEIVQLYQKIWQAGNGGLMKECFQKANDGLAEGKPGIALQALHQLLSLQGNHPQALELQGRIFGRMQNQLMVSNACLPLEACLNAAFQVPLEVATGLLTQILVLGPAAGDPDTIKKTRNTAMQQLSALYGGTVSNMPLPSNAGVAAAKPAPPEDPAPQVAPPGNATPQAAAPPPPQPEPVAEPEAPPALSADSFDDVSVELPEDVFETPATEPEEKPVVKEEAPSPPPAPVDDLEFDPNEDLLGIPDEDFSTEVTREETPKPKKKLPLVPILAAAGVIFVVVVAILIFVMMGNKKKREEATKAYQEATNLESVGKWDDALNAWDALSLAYPDMEFADGKAVERHRLLKFKIQEREQKITNHLSRAETLLQDEETPMWEMDESPVSHINEVLNLEPANDRALGMMIVIRGRLSEQVKGLWDEGKVLETRNAYQYMTALDPDTRDPELEEGINQWVQDNVIGPKIAVFDKAMKRKQWEKAREISEELEDVLPDVAVLREKWDAAYAVYEEQYNKARDKENSKGMLAALEVMAEIRPDDSRLVEEKDRLNRTLNLENIVKLENQIKAATRKGNLAGAAVSALKLRKLESENQIAKDAIFDYRKGNEDKIESLKKNNQREALRAYDSMLKVLNWKMYRTARAEVKTRVDRFDGQVARIKKKSVTSFEEAKAEFDRLLSDYPDFAEDKSYQWLTGARRELVSEHDKFKAFLQWENSVREDVTKSFAGIISELGKKKFKFKYANTKLAQFRDYYKDRVENYQDNVTVMIKNARDLPKGRGPFSKKPKTWCKLETSGKTFQTEVANGASPKWSYACNYDVQPGSPLVFSVYHKKNNELIGTVSMKKIPKNGKNITLKPDSGSWNLVIDVKRER